jgi:hypothetical protein
MNKTAFVRGVFGASAIVFRIMSILSLVGGICLLLSVFALSVFPANLFSVETGNNVVTNLNLSSLYGENWKDVLADSAVPEGFEETETGYRRSDAETVTVENRGFALALIPVLAEMFTTFLFYRCLANAARSVKDAVYSPFTPALVKEVKTAGIVLFFLAAGPALCRSLIMLLTAGKQTFSLGSTEIEFSLVLWGFVLLALSFLFEYAASLTPPFQGQKPEDGIPKPPADENV